jgi:hypothetical protein
MQFVEVGVPHEIVQTFMHVNVGITSSYMWGSHGCAPFIHTNILAHRLINLKKKKRFHVSIITIETLFYVHLFWCKMINFLVDD